MSHNMTITFLGTASGGGPSETRNCSSLVLDALGDGSLWMVDCAEGTVRQFEQQAQALHFQQRLRINRVTKIFITHMHADHTMGLITMLRNILGIPKTWDNGASPAERISVEPKVEIYGPAGTRLFVRSNFKLTHSRSAENYTVHELLMRDEASSAVCEPATEMHANEEPGRDIVCDEDGFWRDFADARSRSGGGKLSVDAGAIVHRVPCLGYVFREHPPAQNPTQFLRIPNPFPPPRTIVILGDTSDASSLIPLILTPSSSDTTGAPITPSVSLLIYEATDAYIPPEIDARQTTGRNRSTEIVEAKALEKGHSTPVMAGRFAKAIGAERLVLNHIGARFPAPTLNACAFSAPRTGTDRFRLACMREIEAQANAGWNPPPGVGSIAAWDFCQVVVPPNPRPPAHRTPDDTLEEVKEKVRVDVEMEVAEMTLRNGDSSISVDKREVKVDETRHGSSHYGQQHHHESRQSRREGEQHYRESGQYSHSRRPHARGDSTREYHTRHDGGRESDRHWDSGQKREHSGGGGRTPPTNTRSHHNQDKRPRR